MNPITISIVDDHVMITNALSNMLDENPSFSVINTSSNGEEFMEYLESGNTAPEVVLMDVNMPIKNGTETTQALTENYPEIKVIALTMEDDDATIIKMLKAGAKGYLLKDMHPDILFDAINTVSEKGIFYTDIVTQSLLKIRTDEKSLEEIKQELKERELEFLQYACSELTYREIAEKMFLSPKTIDNYRDSVFIKLNVKSRVGLVLYAIKNGLISDIEL